MAKKQNRRSTAGKTRKAIKLWRDGTMADAYGAAASGEPYDPPMDGDGEIDRERTCVSNPEILAVDVWAVYYLAWCDWEEKAQTEQEARTEKDLTGAAYLRCRGMVV